LCDVNKSISKLKSKSKNNNILDRIKELLRKTDDSPLNHTNANSILNSSREKLSTKKGKTQKKIRFMNHVNNLEPIFPIIEEVKPNWQMAPVKKYSPLKKSSTTRTNTKPQRRTVNSITNSKPKLHTGRVNSLKKLFEKQ
jgi:hypothetical protein